MVTRLDVEEALREYEDWSTAIAELLDRHPELENAVPGRDQTLIEVILNDIDSYHYTGVTELARETEEHVPARTVGTGPGTDQTEPAT